MKVWIIRHGQTDWNKNGKIQGSTDIELNETGIKQAEEVIPTFNEHNFDLIISSTLKRAMKTAQIINREKNVEIIFMTPNMMCTKVSAHLEKQQLIQIAESSCNTEIKGVLEMYLNAAREIAEEKGIPVCDCYIKWKKLYQNGGHL